VDDPDPFDLSDVEFDAALTSIDRELQQESDRIGGREVRAWVKFCKHFHISIGMDDPLATRIFAWFAQRYGDRLNMDLDFGKSVVAVYGDLYRMNCFRLYGTAYAVCSTTLTAHTMQYITPSGDITPMVNLLNGSIDGLTQNLAQRLSDADCTNILKAYRRMFLAFTGLEAALGAPYIKEAMDDLTVSADALLLRKPNYGQSQWSSLQAAEKVIKSFLFQKNGTHRKSHDLNDLCVDASAVGLPTIDAELILAIQCKPDVRYDSTLVTKPGAIAAHEAALVVCGTIAPFVNNDSSFAGACDVFLPMPRKTIVPALMLWHTGPRPPGI
jgi:hypothetical protein